MPTERDDDPELVRRSLAGETGAFSQLVEKHQRLVFGVALSGARDAAVAEEVAQEAFVEAWRDLRKLRDHGRVGTWIAGIARNLARTWSRTAARRRAQVPVVTAELSATTAATPLDTKLAAESRELVREALAQIPAAYREALVLFYVQGQSVSEVAAGLGISEELAKQRLHRGRGALREAMEKRVEGALTALRPSKAFTSVVMVAVSSAIATKASAATTAGAAGKLLPLMAANKLVLGAATIIVATGAIWYGVARGGGGNTPGKATAPVLSSTTTTMSAPAATPDAGRVRTGARRFADRAERERLLASIRQAQARDAARRNSTSSSVGGGGGTATGDAPSMDKEYIMDRVRDLLPFLKECYEVALEDTPTLAGNLTVKFKIEGTADTGGLVTQSDVDPESTIGDPGFHECIRETMYGLEIDPPEDGSLDVTYKFAFSPDGPPPEKN